MAIDSMKMGAQTGQNVAQQDRNPRKSGKRIVRPDLGAGIAVGETASMR